MKNFFTKSKILVISLLIVGFVLRVFRIDTLATFHSDQAIELLSTYNILQGHPTLIGIKTSISEVRNGAVMYYLNAPMLFLFNYHPIAGGIVQTLLSLASGLVAYYVARKYYHKKSGLLALFLVCASPLLVKFSRQNLLAFSPLFFASISIYLFCYLTERYRTSIIILLGVILGIALQVHFSTITILGSALVFPWVFLRKKKAKYYLCMVLGFVLGFLPYLFFEVRHEWFNTKMLLSFISQFHVISGGYQFSLITYSINVVSQLLTGDNRFLAVSVVLFVGLYVFVKRKILNNAEKVSLLMFGSSIIFVFLFVHDYTPHYLINAFIPFLLLCVGAVTRYIKRISGIVWIGMACLFLVLNGRSYHLFDNHGWTMSPGWTLSGIEKAAQLISSDVQTNEYNVAMVVDAENQGLPLRYFLQVYKKPPLSVEHYDSARVLYVVIEPKTMLTDVHMFEIESFGEYTIKKNWNIQNGYSLYRLEKKDEG